MKKHAVDLTDDTTLAWKISRAPDRSLCRDKDPLHHHPAHHRGHHAVAPLVPPVRYRAWED